MRVGEIGCYLLGKEARNSEMRSWSAKYTEGMARFLTEKFPKLKANHISWLGFIGTLGGSAVNAYSDNNVLAGMTQVAGSLVDALDGPVARQGRGSENGFLHDVSADKLSEASIFWGHAKSAKTRFGRTAALLALSTCVVPALVRSSAEASGYITEEDGGSKLSLLGTRAGRCALGVLGTASLEVQPITDSASAVSNLYAAFSRIKTMKKNDNLESDLPKIGRKKLPVLLGIFVLTNYLAIKLHDANS